MLPEHFNYSEKKKAIKGLCERPSNAQVINLPGYQWHESQSCEFILCQVNILGV